MPKLHLGRLPLLGSILNTQPLVLEHRCPLCRALYIEYSSVGIGEGFRGEQGRFPTLGVHFFRGTIIIRIMIFGAYKS